MNFIVIFITFSSYFGNIQTFHREDNALYESNGVEPATYSKDQPRLNMYKDELMQDYNPGNRYIYMVDDFGIIHRIDTEEETQAAPTFSLFSEPKLIFYLFTRVNRHVPQTIEHGNELSLIESNFRAGKNTVVITHGYGGNIHSPMVKSLTESFLIDEDVNVIVFDWGQFAGAPYILARSRTSEVGRNLGQFVRWLTTIGYTMYQKVHLVGHSLGAHLVGNAGREIGGVVARITAMDPAGPGWDKDEDRLVSTDAEYVEVIHTNAGGFGLEDPCGDADFYPNGGKKMPGSYNFVAISAYSHSCSWEYMSRSLKNNSYEARKCRDYIEMEKDNCNGRIYKMGNSDLHKKGRGIFRLNIAKECTENKSKYI